MRGVGRGIVWATGRQMTACCFPGQSQISNTVLTSVCRVCNHSSAAHERLPYGQGKGAGSDRKSTPGYGHPLDRTQPLPQRPSRGQDLAHPHRRIRAVARGHQGQELPTRSARKQAAPVRFERTSWYQPVISILFYRTPENPSIRVIRVLFLAHAASERQDTDLTHAADVHGMCLVLSPSCRTWQSQ